MIMDITRKFQMWTGESSIFSVSIISDLLAAATSFCSLFLLNLCMIPMVGGWVGEIAVKAVRGRRSVWRRRTETSCTTCGQGWGLRRVINVSSVSTWRVGPQHWCGLGSNIAFDGAFRHSKKTVISRPPALTPAAFRSSSVITGGLRTHNRLLYRVRLTRPFAGQDCFPDLLALFWTCIGP